MECSICKREVTLNCIREGVCWGCATAESIISDGVDMYDNGLDDKEPVTKPMDKVRLLLSKGWNW